MATLTKADIVREVNHDLDLPISEAQELVDLVLGEVSLCLEDNEIVKISGFGNFELKDKNARPGRNPRTGEVVPVSARRVVTFHPGQKLKNRIDQNVDTIKKNMDSTPNT